MKITDEQRKKVKGEGFLSNKDGEHFSMRVITENGVLDVNKINTLSEVAQIYGGGKISFTSRLSIEIPGIKFKDIEEVKSIIAKDGMMAGGTGPKVRPIVACKGTVCSNGLFDTQRLATEIHKRFYEGYKPYILPHKFKIAVGGCPNNCVKPDLNDLGIVGQLVQNFDLDKCEGCKKCRIEDICPMNAAKIESEKLIVDKELCIFCGACVGKCYFNVIPNGELLYKIYIGGRWGKKIRIGSALDKLFTEEETMDIIEKAILLFKLKGLKGERFSTTIDRIGVKEVEMMLITDDILGMKDEILEIKTVGGAMC